MDCPSCRTVASGPDQRFCATCGTRLAPVEPPPAFGQPPRITGPLFADDASPGRPIPPPPPPRVAPPPPGPFPPPPRVEVPYPYPSPPLPASYDDDRGSRRRTSIVLLLAAAVIAALIGAGGVVLLLGGDDDPTTDTAADRRDGQAATTDAQVTSSATESETASEPETDEPATFRCWNGGAPVMRLATCPPPSGADGMAWVFPSSKGATCTSSAGVQRASEVDCAPIVGGDPVRVHYSEWRTRPDLDIYYGRNTIAQIASPDGRDDLTTAQVESRDPDVGYKVAVYYADPAGLWSVTIYAADEEQYQAVLDELEVRPFRQLRGKRAG